MTHTPEDIVKRFYRDLLAHGGRDGASDVLAPDYVDHGFSTHEHGRDAFLRRAEEFRSAFRNRLIVLEDIEVADEHVVARWSAGLTHTGGFQGLVPSGDQVDVAGSDVFRVVNGRIAERWNHESGLGLIDQLHLRASMSGIDPRRATAHVEWEPAVALAH